MVNHTAIPHVNQTDVDICPQTTDVPISITKVHIIYRPTPPIQQKS